MIYLATVYSSPDPEVREQRFEAACRAAACLMRAGLCVLAPIPHSHPIAKYGLPTNWEFWAAMDREFLAMCDGLAVLTLPGWQESIGVQAEIQIARELGLQIVYLAPEELDGDACPSSTLAKLQV